LAPEEPPNLTQDRPDTPRDTVDPESDSLPGRIWTLHREGKLPTPFGAEHIRENLKEEYAENYINVVLANYCEGTGDYVKKGQRAWFRRVSKGRYELL
jgi:hypothetical protein